MSLKEISPAGSKLTMPQPCVLVIFGGDGDLSWRKLLPAVYNLNKDGAVPSHFAVVCFGLASTREADGKDPDEYIRGRARDGIQRFSRHLVDDNIWADFARCLFFVPGSFNDAQAYLKLKARLQLIDQQFGIPGSRVYYLSIPPQFVEMCVCHLGQAGMVAAADEGTGFSRVIVEKPIGRDLESARRVIRAVDQAFAERQTYRIDHYLGKETVQNLMVLRFANSIFEPLWNSKYIDHVQITVAEQEGLVQWDHKTGEMVASRIGYFEGVGALRDMVQNHILQAWELVSWLSLQLGWKVQTGRVRPGTEIAWQFAGPSGAVHVRIRRLDEGLPQIRRIRIGCKLDGKPGAIIISVDGHDKLSVELEGSDALARTILVPLQRPGEIIGRQLSDRERDLTFRESMAVAGVLARSLGG